MAFTRFHDDSCRIAKQLQESIPEPFPARQVLRLFEAVDDYDDTQSVYGNFDIPEQLVETIEI